MTKRYNSRPHLHGGVVHNGVLYASGHAATDLELDMKGQTAEICEKLDALLAQVGSDKTKLLQARVYLSDMSAKAQMNEAWMEWLDTAHMPSRAAIGGCDLGDPKRLVEIVVTAAVD
ncbi:RidA family protein [Salipiger sp. P9]|uniref:RidA family protein n=1 Tax=Salipiger pentaromativorans TaxID=2943193 RepID=UPI0021576536|nr:RidA family protein [Salipiger pentaromativorans]MCR8549164.1 RidA family protein [Salipiger pentaromativorans]